MNEKLILKCNHTRDSIKDTNTGKNNHLVATSSHPMKFIDLCSGIGGFHIGLKQHTCILACDINKNCRESYKRNYNIDCKKDIFDLHANDISDFHILCAGFPCQPFSSAGLKKGLDDNRSQVYDKILELVTAKKPNLVFLENVKNLLVMDDGNVIKKIINDFKSIGYNISYTILNTAHFGLAQNRERVFIVCVNKSVYGDKTFDFSNLKQINITKSLKDVIDTNNNTYIEEDKYVLLDTDKIKTQKSGIVFCGYLKGNLRKNGTLPNTDHLSRVHKQPYRIYHINGVNPTLSSSEVSGRYHIYDGMGVRKLTVRECFGLMGFPSTYTLHEKSNINLSQIGNAVSPIIIEYIHDELTKQGFIQNLSV